MIEIPRQKMLAAVKISLWGTYPPCIYKTKTAYHLSGIAEQIYNWIERKADWRSETYTYGLQW